MRILDYFIHVADDIIETSSSKFLHEGRKKHNNNITILYLYSEENYQKEDKIKYNKLVKTLINTLNLQNNLRGLNNMDGWDKD